MRVKEESEKSGLKLNTQKTKIMESGPIISWQIDGETTETVTDLILLGSKVTADGDCSHEIKRRLLLRRKAMTKLDSILKSRNIADKGPSSQRYGFSNSHVKMCSIHFSCSVVSNFSNPWTAARQAPCLSPTLGAYSNSCPLSQ